MDEFDRDFNRTKKWFWIFFGIVIAIIIAMTILSVVLNIYYVKGLFNADIPEWLKWVILTFG